MPEETISQKTIEHFFQKHNITDADQKAKLLTEITDIIYEYNMLVVKHEKEQDAYKKKQVLTDVKETENKIDEIITETANRQ